MGKYNIHVWAYNILSIDNYAINKSDMMWNFTICHRQSYLCSIIYTQCLRFEVVLVSKGFYTLNFSCIWITTTSQIKYSALFQFPARRNRTKQISTTKWRRFDHLWNAFHDHPGVHDGSPLLPFGLPELHRGNREL